MISGKCLIEPLFIDLVDLWPLFLGDAEPSSVAIPALHDHVGLKESLIPV